MMDTAIIALAAIIEKVGAWPLGLLICILSIGPWLVLMTVSRSQERRFDAMSRMYENNVELVKKYEKLSGEQQDVIIMNTNAVKELTVIVKERVK